MEIPFRRKLVTGVVNKIVSANEKDSYPVGIPSGKFFAADLHGLKGIKVN